MKKHQNAHNVIPSTVFTPFKKNRIRTAIFAILSFLLSVFMLIKVLLGELSFNQEQLNSMADFTLNLVFVVAALGLTIFTLPLKNEHPEKDTILFSYIGTSLLIASISVFTYILSYCDFLNVSIFNITDLFSIYFCAMLMLVCRCITSILSAIIAYFDIKD